MAEDFDELEREEELAEEEFLLKHKHNILGTNPTEGRITHTEQLIIERKDIKKKLKEIDELIEVNENFGRLDDTYETNSQILFAEKEKLIAELERDNERISSPPTKKMSMFKAKHDLDSINEEIKEITITARTEAVPAEDIDNLLEKKSRAEAEL